ncbi:MAG TPA: glycosyltransferase family 4 protein [Candidatus Nanoarchaeia archaeon]|nr:glycosyltransferase family 4 protein [Candidatus Nanoarchaeia archaeon]
MKNVLVLTSTFPRWENDTTPSFVLDLSKKIAEKYKVTVLAPHAYSSKRKEAIGNLEVKRFRYFFPLKSQKVAYGAGILPNIKSSQLAKLQIPLFLASQLKNAVSIMRKEKVELIHAHWQIPQGIIGVYLKKMFKVPLVVTIHGSDLFPLKSSFLKKLQHYVVKNADKITVNSDTAKKELVSRFPDSETKIRIISMGVDTKLFSSKKTALSKKYPKQKIILFVGRINEQKGIEYLIDAMPRVLKKIKNAHLVIIGEGGHKKSLIEKSRKMGLGKCMDFTGPKTQKEISDFYNLSDVFVLPSVTSKIGTESFGLVIAEAMACGTCVIGSSSGGIKDIIQDEKNGLIFEEKNSSELAEKIILVLSNPKLRNSLAKNGAISAKNNYSWDIVSKKFLEIYGELLK